MQMFGRNPSRDCKTKTFFLSFYDQIDLKWILPIINISRPKRSINAETVISLVMYTYWLKQVLFHHLIKFIIDFVVLFFCSWSQHKLLQEKKKQRKISLKSLISSGIYLRQLNSLSNEWDFLDFLLLLICKSAMLMYM